MSEDRKHTDLIGPVLLIGIGLIVLLNNLGYIDWGFWDVLRLWPVLLIGAGLEILIGRRSLLGSIIAAVLVLILLLGGIWLISRPAGSDTFTEVTFPRNGVRAAYVRLAPTIGTLRLTGNTETEALLEGTVEVGRNESLDRRFVEGDIPQIILETEGSGGTGFMGPQGTRLWDLTLNADVELDLVADMGAGSVDLDLADMTLEDLSVDLGVGDIDIRLPDHGTYEAMIDGGIGILSIEVPKGAGIRLAADTGLVTRSIPSTYTQSGDVYTSPNYEEADHRIDLTASLGIGSLTVREVPLP